MQMSKCFIFQSVCVHFLPISAAIPKVIGETITSIGIESNFCLCRETEEDDNHPEPVYKKTMQSKQKAFFLVKIGWMQLNCNNEYLHK